MISGTARTGVFIERYAIRVADTVAEELNIKLFTPAARISSAEPVCQ